MPGRRRLGKDLKVRQGQRRDLMFRRLRLAVAKALLRTKGGQGVR